MATVINHVYPPTRPAPLAFMHPVRLTRCCSNKTGAPQTPKTEGQGATPRRVLFCRGGKLKQLCTGTIT